jgi:hypothetical protein
MSAWFRSALWALMLKLAACGAVSGCGPVQPPPPPCIEVPAGGACRWVTTDDTGASCCRELCDGH